jgi:release factor glutamine methyltransferase
MVVTADLARMLSRSGVDLMALKGPFLQQRLYGTPAAYPSGDVDVLLRRSDGAKARSIMKDAGWRFEPENMFLWRLSRTATFERHQVRIDLHWGLHAGELPSFALNRLERALWDRAELDTNGLFQPSLDALVVYLAVHAASHGFSRSSWVEVIGRAAEKVTDWDPVWTLARECRVHGTLVRALEVVSGQADCGADAPILDGWQGRAWDASFRLARSRLVPQRVRDAMRGPLGRVTGRGNAVVDFAGLRLTVFPHVWPPSPISERLVDFAVESVADLPHPRIVDVGTGSGAVAIGIATRRPDAEVHGVDPSRDAVRCARANARRLRVDNVTFHLGDLLDPVRAQVADVVVSNPPYVPPGITFRAGVTTEMVKGGGFDGLDLLRRLVDDAKGILRPGGALVLQLADAQWDGFGPELAAAGYQPRPVTERRPGRALAVRADFVPAAAP